MNRKQFLQTLALLPAAGTMSHLHTLEHFAAGLPASPLMPVLFLGHGSPMNAIEENQFVRGFREVARGLPKPAAILCVSAHWLTSGTQVTVMEHPKTIHDFGGFPRALYEVEYPAPGSPALAKETAELLKPWSVGLSQDWGLDHGAWSVIKHLYPKADVPVIQLSIDYSKPASWHFDLARQLSALRRKGILILGSGNIVHNLGLVDFARINEVGYGFDWAIEARSVINDLLKKGDFSPLLNYQQLGKAVSLAVPSPDHFLPLLYTLALREKQEPLALFNDEMLAGSLSMTSVKIG